jgi:hypothetical protein
MFGCYVTIIQSKVDIARVKINCYVRTHPQMILIREDCYVTIVEKVIVLGCHDQSQMAETTLMEHGSLEMQ